MDYETLKQWIGRTETLQDQATLAPLQALGATLDRDDPAPQNGDAVAPCWHWLYFLGSMPFSVELDITGTDERSRRPVAWRAARDWPANV